MSTFLIDFRQYCNTNYPSILDGYYKIGEIYRCTTFRKKKKKKQHKRRYDSSFVNFVGELFDTAGTIETIRKQDNTVWAAAAAKSSSKEL